jgi:hypothetical protein
LKHLCLHSQHLLKSKRRRWRWVGVLVIVLPIVSALLVETQFLVLAI